MTRSTTAKMFIPIVFALFAVSVSSGSSFADIDDASPEPDSCGQPVSAWGAASANDVQVELIEVRTMPVPKGSTPSAATVQRVLAHLRFTNQGMSEINVDVRTIELQFCDGSRASGLDATDESALKAGSVSTGEVDEGWVQFDSKNGDVPSRLVVPVSRPGLEGGRVEFPLLSSSNASPAAGASGADAVGGNAFGGDGADGADATPT